jgi:acyl carrier protein
MEEAFNCEIKEEQAEKFTTVRSLIEYLNAETLAGKLNK